MATQRLSPEQQQAKARVRAIAEGVRVWKLQEGRYACPSSNQPGIAYWVVAYPNGDITCGCPAALTPGRVCKHQAAVGMLLEAEAALNGQAQANGVGQGEDELYGGHN